jgi:hypothetical protein
MGATVRGHVFWASREKDAWLLPGVSDARAIAVMVIAAPSHSSAWRLNTCDSAYTAR